MTTTEYWEEAVSYAFDSCQLYSIWESIPKEKKEEISRSIELSEECKDQAFYSHKNIHSREETEHIQRIKELEKEVEDWKQAFKKNVSRRRGCETHEVSISKDGTALF